MSRPLADAAAFRGIASAQLVGLGIVALDEREASRASHGALPLSLLRFVRSRRQLETGAHFCFGPIVSGDLASTGHIRGRAIGEQGVSWIQAPRALSCWRGHFPLSRRSGRSLCLGRSNEQSSTGRTDPGVLAGPAT